MRGKAIFLAALLLLSPGVLLATDSAQTKYPSADTCMVAEKGPCERLPDGSWVKVENGDGAGESAGEVEFDEYFGMRTARAFQTNQSGTADNPRVILDMDEVNFPDAKPYLDHEINRVRVPIRFVAEAMGAQVEWDQTTQTVDITREGLSIQLVINQSTAVVNGKTLAIDAPAKLVEDRTMVPLRFISEAFGANVEWVGTDSPIPGDQVWGQYQVWIWIPWGYWGMATIHERENVYKWWWHRDEVTP